MLQSLQHGSHPPPNPTLSLLQFTSSQSYGLCCSPVLLLSLIPSSLSSHQRKHLGILSNISLGSALVASLLFALMDDLSVVLFFSSYMPLGTRFNPLAPRWMMHHDVEAQTGF